jgi:hypothetical protein
LGLREWDDYDYEDDDDYDYEDEELSGSWRDFLAGLADANRIRDVKA